MDSRPHIDTKEAFVPLLVRSKLFAESQLESILESYREEYLSSAGCSDTLTSLCTFLIARGLLTSWQCGMLRRGQHKGFIVDDFVLLDSVGQDNGEMCYLAREASSGDLVRLAIKPHDGQPVEGLDYRKGQGFDYRFVEKVN